MKVYVLLIDTADFIGVYSSLENAIEASKPWDKLEQGIGGVWVKDSTKFSITEHEIDAEPE